ncbi:Uncharacterized protein Rs2_19183 [Raphanus sativus]|nr:Uncharacterized protein Rs2_19183 [Raphanus sativus]
MASSNFEKPQEEEDHIEDEPYVYVEPPPFDASILTPAQLVTLNELQKKYPGSAKTSLARRIRLELIRDRAELEGREVTHFEFNIAYDLKEVMCWAPPLQRERIKISTLKLQLEEICLPCDENNAPDLDPPVLINECLDLICETRKLDELRNYLCASTDLESEFLMLNESRPLLELVDLGDELDNVKIVYYLIDGDRVDYFVKTSFEPVVDFVFPPNAFDSHHNDLNLKDHLMIHDTSLVKLSEEKSVYYLWVVVCSFAHFVSCVCRRRIKSALAQPFDTYD